MKTRNSINLIGSSLLIKTRAVSKITHRTEGTATIYIMVYTGVSTTDGHVGVTIDMAATHGIVMSAAAAIDIAHFGSAKITPVATGKSNGGFTDSSTTDYHMGISSKASSKCLTQNNRLAHGSHLTTAIYTGPYRTICHVDLCSCLYATSNILGIRNLLRVRIRVVNEFFYEATIAASKDATKGVLHRFTVFDLRTDCTVVDDDFSTHIDISICSALGSMSTHYLAQLATTIYTTLDYGITADSQLSALDTTQLPPVKRRNRCCSATQHIHASHTTSKDVAALGVRQLVVGIVGIFIVVAYCAATDGHGNVSASFGKELCSRFRRAGGFGGIVVDIIRTHRSVWFHRLSTNCNLFIDQVQTIAYRCQSSATIDRAEYFTIQDAQINRTAHITCGQCLACESTAATKHVTVII